MGNTISRLFVSVLPTVTGFTDVDTPEDVHEQVIIADRSFGHEGANQRSSVQLRTLIPPRPFWTARIPADTVNVQTVSKNESNAEKTGAAFEVEHKDQTDSSTYDQNLKHGLHETQKELQDQPADEYKREDNDARPTVHEIHAEQVENLRVLQVKVLIKGKEETNDGSSRTMPAEETCPETASCDPATDTSPTCTTINIDRCEFLEAHCSTVHVDVAEAEIQHITDERIEDAVGNVVFTKVTWIERKVKKLEEKLVRAKRRGVKRAKELSEMYIQEMSNLQEELENTQKRGQEELEEEAARYTEVVAQLAEASRRQDEGALERKGLCEQLKKEKTLSEKKIARLSYELDDEQKRGEGKLADLVQAYEREKKEEEDKVMTFVLRLEERDRQVLNDVSAHIDEHRLREVVLKLFQDFNIRLLGVDCGLNFLMDAPVARWMSVIERQLEIRDTLERLLPQHLREEVTWSEMIHCGPEADDVDVQLGQPLPVQVTLDGQESTSDEELELSTPSSSLHQTLPGTFGGSAGSELSTESCVAESAANVEAKLQSSTQAQQFDPVCGAVASSDGLVSEDFGEDAVESSGRHHEPYDVDPIHSSLQERFFEYDIFPSYDSSDQDWVTQYLMSELEDRQELRLCIHPRDFVPGLYVVDNIQAAIERSRKLMVLFTKNFAKSQWCMYELRLFIMEVQERGEELIVVFLEDIPAEDTTSEMEAASAVYPCYKWPDGARARKKFWKALYKAAIKGTDRDRSVLDKVLKKLFK